jgi:hypothetical protein
MIEAVMEGVVIQTLKLLGIVLLFGIGIGVLISRIPDAWAAIKPWIHSVTG